MSKKPLNNLINFIERYMEMHRKQLLTILDNTGGCPNEEYLRLTGAIHAYDHIYHEICQKFKKELKEELEC